MIGFSPVVSDRFAIASAIRLNLPYWPWRKMSSNGSYKHQQSASRRPLRYLKHTGTIVVFQQVEAPVLERLNILRFMFERTGIHLACEPPRVAIDTRRPDEQTISTTEAQRDMKEARIHSHAMNLVRQVLHTVRESLRIYTFLINTIRRVVAHERRVVPATTLPSALRFFSAQQSSIFMKLYPASTSPRETMSLDCSSTVSSLISH